MSPGRKLDAHVVMVVKGHQIRRWTKQIERIDGVRSTYESSFEKPEPTMMVFGIEIPVPKYSTDVGAAWTLFSTFPDWEIITSRSPMAENGEELDSLKGWQVKMKRENTTITESAENLPMAICQAALKAKAFI